MSAVLSLQCLCEAVSIVEENQQQYKDNDDSSSIRKKSRFLFYSIFITTRTICVFFCFRNSNFKVIININLLIL